MTEKRKPVRRTPAASAMRDMLTRRRSTPALAARDVSPSIVPFDSEEIIQSLLKAAPSYPRPERYDGYSHVSDLIGKCMRRKALLIATDAPKAAQKITYMDAVTYAQGDAIAEVVMVGLRRASPDTLWGNWRCLCRKTQTDRPSVFSQRDRQEPCVHCDGEVEHYVEVPIFNDQYGVVGSPDVVFWLEELQAFHYAELKSISHKQFEDLVRPKPEHVLQILFYWFLAREAGRRVTDTVTIFYTTKGYVFRGLPYREFTIRPEGMLGRLDELLADALAYKEYEEGTGMLPLRVFCASEQSTEAKKCEMCKVCFSGAYDKTKPNVEYIDISEVYADASKTRRRIRR